MSLVALIFLNCNAVSIAFADLCDEVNLFLGPPPAHVSATARHTRVCYHSSWSCMRARTCPCISMNPSPCCFLAGGIEELAQYPALALELPALEFIKVDCPQKRIAAPNPTAKIPCLVDALTKLTSQC